MKPILFLFLLSITIAAESCTQKEEPCNFPDIIDSVEKSHYWMFSGTKVGDTLSFNKYRSFELSGKTKYEYVSNESYVVSDTDTAKFIEIEDIYNSRCERQAFH